MLLHFIPSSPVDIAALVTLPVLGGEEALGLLGRGASDLNPLLLLLFNLLLLPAPVAGKPPSKVDISTPRQLIALSVCHVISFLLPLTAHLDRSSPRQRV